MSCSPNFNHFKTSWMTICILAAISTIIWQLLNYLSGLDSTIVEFREFNKEKIDVYPNIGVCFSRFFIHDIDRVDPHNYSHFLYGSQEWETRTRNEGPKGKFARNKGLKGKTTRIKGPKGKTFWNDEMLKIDYDEVSKDFDKNLIVQIMKTTSEGKQILIFHKRTKSMTDLHDLPEFKVKSLFGNKCFSLHFPYKREQKLSEVLIGLNLTIFPTRKRPSERVRHPMLDNMFSVVLHYPNQLLRKIGTQQMNWPDRTNKSAKHLIEFNVRNTEVIEKRNKYNDPCREGIPMHSFDDEITHWIINTVGCKPPYWKSFNTPLSQCSTLEQFQRTRELLNLVFSNEFKKANYTGKLPCRSLERIQYDSQDIETHKSEFNVIQLRFNFRDYTYKEVKSVRSMDLQALIG